MTAPVLQSDAEPGLQNASETPKRVDSASRPADADVTLRSVPEAVTAAPRFSGRWSEARCRRHLEHLRSDVTEAGLAVAGPARSARFDPPFLPWFLRHNEVHLGVAVPL
jgi:hypothetical protein